MTLATRYLITFQAEGGMTLDAESYPLDPPCDAEAHFKVEAPHWNRIRAPHHARVMLDYYAGERHLFSREVSEIKA